MTDEPSNRTDRRRFLSTLAVAGVATVAGCGTWGQHGATDVVLYNAGADATVSVTITESDAEEPHTSRTLDLSEGERIDPVNESKLPTNASYAVEVTVEGGPSETFEWDDPELELAPLHVIVDDTENVTFALQAG